MIDTDTDAKPLVAHAAKTNASHAAFQRRSMIPPPNAIGLPPSEPDDMGQKRCGQVIEAIPMFSGRYGTFEVPRTEAAIATPVASTSQMENSFQHRSALEAILQLA